MKESEAKSKWCPLTGGEKTAGKCLGSECMWWVHGVKDCGECAVTHIDDCFNSIMWNGIKVRNASEINGPNVIFKDAKFPGQP